MLLLLLRCAGILSIPFWIKSGSQPGDIEFSRLRALTHDFAEKAKTPPKVIVPASDDLDLTMELERRSDLSEAEREMKVRYRLLEDRWENTELLCARATIRHMEVSMQSSFDAGEARSRTELASLIALCRAEFAAVAEAL